MNFDFKESKTERGKIIAIWGNDGISCLTQILAKQLSKKREKQVIVINNDKVIPMQPIWHPQKKVKTEKSIGLLLRNKEINTSVLAESLEIYDPYQEIATLGYCDGNNELTEKEVAPYSTYIQILKTASEIADYVLIDCTKNITNLLNVAALEISDVVVMPLTADIKGITFWKSNIPLLSNEKFNKNKFITVANATVPYNDINTFKEIVGDICCALPYQLQIHENDIEGMSFDISDTMPTKYKIKFNKLLTEIHQIIKMNFNNAPQTSVSGGDDNKQ